MNSQTLKKDIEEIELMADRLRAKCIGLKTILNQSFPDAVSSHPTISTKSKKKEYGSDHYDVVRRVHEHVQLRSQARKLQIQFNLLTVPHNNRVLEYNKSRNPAVFEGLKRRPHEEREY